jgi:hypothetical protein
MGIDDFIEQMKLGDLEGASKMAPIPYAKSRGIYPQKVYAAIRKGKVAAQHCDCGRTVIVVEEADEYFKLGDYRTKEVVGGEEDSVSNSGQ